MKRKQSIFAVFLSFVIALTFTPVLSVNADSDELTFTLRNGGRLWDFVGQSDNTYMFGLYEKGNYFMLEYADGTEDEFDYNEGYNDEGYWVYGFFPDDGDLSMEPVEIVIEKFDYANVSYGPNYTRLGIKYKGKYYEVDKAVPFRGVYGLNAKFSKNKYYYNGKVQTPAFKVVADDGKNTVVPASAYKYTWEPGRKNVGYYSVLIEMKNPNDYDYEPFSYETFSIDPPKPAKVSVKAGKKSFTVKWKKFSKAQQKQITKIKIEYTTDKKFKKGIKTVYVSKKSYKKTIKKLKKKKTYYVKVTAYKNVTTEGYTDTFESSAATKKVKTR